MHSECQVPIYALEACLVCERAIVAAAGGQVDENSIRKPSNATVDGLGLTSAVLTSRHTCTCTHNNYVPHSCIGHCALTSLPHAPIPAIHTHVPDPCSGSYHAHHTRVPDSRSGSYHAHTHVSQTHAPVPTMHTLTHTCPRLTLRFLPCTHSHTCPRLTLRFLPCTHSHTCPRLTLRFLPCPHTCPRLTLRFLPCPHTRVPDSRSGSYHTHTHVSQTHAPVPTMPTHTCPRLTLRFLRLCSPSCS